METACVDGHSRLSGHIRTHLYRYEKAFIIKVKVCACVMCVQYTGYDNNISPSLLIIKIIILYFIQIRHTDAFPPTGTLLVIVKIRRGLAYSIMQNRLVFAECEELTEVEQSWPDRTFHVRTSGYVDKVFASCPIHLNITLAKVMFVLPQC